jgi:hypothetical protein
MMKCTQDLIDRVNSELAGRTISGVTYDGKVLTFRTDAGECIIENEMLPDDVGEALNDTLRGRKIWRVELIHGDAMNILTDDEEGWSTAQN